MNLSDLIGGNTLPPQEGQAGKLLATNGEDPEWVEIKVPPSIDIYQAQGGI